MEGSSTETEWNGLPYNQWAESHVSSWLKSIGIKAAYIQKLEDEETTGPLLSSLDKDYLVTTIGMKGSQIQHLLKKRDELLKSEPNEKTEISKFNACTESKESKSISPSGHESCSPLKPCEVTESENIHTECTDMSTFTGECFSDYRKFDEDEKSFKYVKHRVLQPETGIENMIVPCHEYKSLEIAHKLDSTRLQAKVASEVLRFACGCMNVRTNGTIHFGVMDKVRGKHQHGEIIGIPVTVDNREDFVNALDYIERCFKGSDHQIDVRRCIRNPKFIEVIDKDAKEKTWVVEYDIVPKASIVKGKLYSVGVPKFDENKKKVKCEEKVCYQRKGANTPRVPEDELVGFIQALKDNDVHREEAESSMIQTTADYREDQQRKISILLTSGKKYIDDSQRFILVTNKCKPEDIDSISFLTQMNLFCVFDFDPDSKTSGLCSRYKEHHAANLHFPHDYANIGGLGTAATQNEINHLELFERTSWIFCNGRNDFRGGQEPCDEKTWIKTRKKELKKAVSVICNDILPKHSFIVMFLLMSHVEQPIVEAFHEFYAEMNGHEDLAVIAESIEIDKKWSSLAQLSCDMTVLKEISIVMPLSHVDATVQSIQLSKNRPIRRLPVFNGGLCFLKSVEEDMMNSLEIISFDQCDDTKIHSMDPDEITRIDKYFYRGGKLDWINLWLADKKLCEDIMQRDAYKEANKILENIVYRSKAIVRPTESVNIYHHPSSGGSTVARQLLWTWRTKVRCAVVKQSKETVCEQAMRLREYEERDKNNCLPVLLLLEDCNADYIDDLRRLLGSIIATRKISPSLCFILLICKRSNDPERIRCRVPQTVAVIHKLSDEEKILISKTSKWLKLKNYEPEHIFTFVLMSKEFNTGFIENFVQKVFLRVDHSSPETRLIRFVSLLNSYVHDSYIPVSHCELCLGLASYVDRVRYQAFVEHLSEEARLMFIHLRESSTHIKSIRIILPVLAEEILKQLSVNLSESEIAMDLIKDRVLLNNRFGREEFLTFMRALFIRRNKKSRGDAKDTTFSPLIEHIITERDGVQKAVNLMEAAYISLEKDPFVAQQLARLLYTNKRFEEALKWAEDAKSSLPHDTFVLDTLGQVYKRWFYHLLETLEEKEPTPERAVEIIHVALKGISAFRASEQKQKKETVSLNNSYYGEVDVGCKLLHFLSMVECFSSNDGNSDLMSYLLTEYIPSDVKEPWHKFHPQLKGLHESLYNALEYISEGLCYFQTDISEEDEELDAREPEQVHSPREWLTRKSTAYAAFFVQNVVNQMTGSINTEDMTQFQRQMKTYELGGGNITSILSLLYDTKPERAVGKLEAIIGMYPENLRRHDVDKTELTNLIFCQIALHCISPGSSKLLSLQKLQHLCMTFNRDGRNTNASALFLLSLLFWPETDDDYTSGNIKILVSAIDTLQRTWQQKIEHTCPRKSRIVTHFYLAKARGLNKIVHRTAIEKHIKGPVSERKLKWLGGEVWKTKEVVQSLRRVEGWTENGSLFIKGETRDSRIKIFPRYSASLPNANENVTFYLGFSFNGVLAFDIQVMD